MKQDLFDISGKEVLLLYPDKPYGHGIALGLHRLGATLTLCGPNKEDMLALAEKLGLKNDRVISYEPGTELAAITLADQFAQKRGSPDAVVYINPGSALDTWTPDFDELYASLHVSQLGLMLTVKHLGLLMAQSKRGSVIFVTDYGALVGYDPENYAEDFQLFQSDFTLDRGFASGSYVNYARQAAGFLGEYNIRCNTLAFGPLPDEKHASFGEAVIRHSHLKRLLETEDLTAAVAFFVADASSFITGVTLPIDGGYTAK